MARPKDAEADFVTATIQPLTTILDNRSTPDLMPPNSVRLRKNYWVTDQNKICRAPGWTRAFPDIGRNADLHDQLLALQTYFAADDPETSPAKDVTTYPNDACDGDVQTRTTGRQPVTLLYSAQGTSKVRKFIAATESRIYALNGVSGDYKIIGDGFGAGTSNGTCPRRRFYASQNQDAVIFTNDFDDPVYYLIDQQTFGCDMQAVSTIAELILIGVRKAACTWTFRRSTFFANVEVDGVRRANRIYWSGDGDPFSFDPANPESITGFKDLSDGETILGAAEVAGYMLVFTDKSIWQITVVGGEQVFQFNKRYTPKKEGEACLFYRNTLVTTGSEVYYLGVDGLYRYDLFISKPDRIDWAHRATGTLFSEIDPACCDNHVAEYYRDGKALFISYATKDSAGCFPNQTLILFTEPGFHVAVTMDFGATAFSNAQVDTRETIRDWIIRNGVCTAEEMDNMGYGVVKEGLPDGDVDAESDPIDSIYTNQALHIEDLDVDIEDYTKETPDENSLCAKLGGSFFEDECEMCETPPAFIFASSQDLCLKQFGGVYYRERCTNPTAIGTIGDAEKPWATYTSSTATYVQDGYQSRTISGPQSFGYPRNDKVVDGLYIEFLAEFQTVPSDLVLRYGQSSQIVDPLTENCALQWFETDPIKLACQSVSAATHNTNSTRPDELASWALYNQGNFLYYDLTVEGKGGAACFSRIDQSYKLIPQTSNYR